MEYSLEAPSFRISVGASAELLMETAEIAGNDDFLLDDFEFTFTLIGSDSDAAAEANVDEMFNDGRIHPVYPIFNGELGLKPAGEEKLEGGIGALAMDFEKRGRRSRLKSSASLSSSEAKELETADYCVWKSNSTGRLRLRDIVLGRSRSEGDKLLLDAASGEERMANSCFALFSSNPKSAAKKVGKRGKRGKENPGAVKELDIATAHRIYYGGGISGGGPMEIAGSRRSFLPYR
ncbi:uncharacterized protein LOC110034575, partial [Phalaenopsis equestris]|uniref:uncharacterized protein LOC110034575 n=1 Tax=Phalaenopsis equestris TaxID=78828 RepID=UPI0009E4D164